MNEKYVRGVSKVIEGLKRYWKKATDLRNKFVIQAGIETYSHNFQVNGGATKDFLRKNSNQHHGERFPS